MKEVEKPWGREEIIVNNDLYCFKKLYILEGKNFSLQYHKLKHETFFIEKGEVLLEKGIDGFATNSKKYIDYILLKEGDCITIPPYTAHRCTSLKGTSTILETSTHHEDSDTYKVLESKLVIASGYFDPIHIGHIEYLKTAKKLGDRLLVILNNDEQAALKKGKSFMPQQERLTILSHLRFVDEVLISVDKDPTVCDSIKAVYKANDTFSDFIFAKGGDRYSYEIPESKICKELGIKIIDGLGEKIQSSSNLIKGGKDLY